MRRTGRRASEGPGGPHFPIGSTVLAGIALALFGAGCGLFTPEDPPPPGEGEQVSLPSLTVDPDSALFSVIEGIASGNQQLYIHGFADSTNTTDTGFHAFFDIQDLLDYQVATGAEPPTDWINQDERTFFPLFSGLRPVNYFVNFFPDPQRPDEFPNPDQEVIYFRKYRIWAGGEPLAVGLADLRIRRVGISDEWKIIGWTDRRDTTASGVLTYGRRRLDSLTFQ